MKNFFLILLLLVLSGCSSEDEKEDDQALCCGHTIESIKATIQANYDRAMEKEDEMSDRQRQILIDQFTSQLDNPCDYFQKELESAGATCDGPH